MDISDKIGKFVEGNDSVLVTEVSEQCFPTLLNLSDIGEGVGRDVGELVELYLGSGLCGLIDDYIVAARKRMLDELCFPEASSTEDDDHLGIIGVVASP